jgi:Cysteine-rich secretory protein family
MLDSGTSWGVMAYRAAICATAGLLLLAAPSTAAESPAEQISQFRLKHGEVKVVRDATLDQIAMDQARAMAAKDNLSHDVLGPFNRRVAPAGAGRAAENIAYGYDNFEKTLGQWIDSSGHRKNLLLPKASRVGIASARDASGKRTYWAMVIAGDYPPKGGKKSERPVVAAEGARPPADKPKPRECRIKMLGLCI